MPPASVRKLSLVKQGRENQEVEMRREASVTWSAGAGGVLTKDASKSRPAGEVCLTGTVFLSPFEQVPVLPRSPQCWP